MAAIPLPWTVWYCKMPTSSRRARDEAAAIKSRALPPGFAEAALFCYAQAYSIHLQIDSYQIVREHSRCTYILNLKSDGGRNENVPRGTKLVSQLRSRREIVDWASDENESALRIRDAHCRLPRPACGAHDPRRIIRTDPKQEVTSMDEGPFRPPKELFELTDCAASDEISENCLRANFLKSLGADFHFGKPDGPYHLG